MEQEKIVSELLGKIGETSLSKRTIETYVSLNPLAEGVEPDDAYYSKAVEFIKAMQGQYNHDIAEFKKNNQQPTTQPKPEPTGNEGDSKVLKLLKQMQADNADLKARLDAKDSAEQQLNLRSQIEAGMKAKGANDEYVLGVTLKGVVFDGSKPVNEQIEKYLAEYDKELTLARGRGATPRQGDEGGNGGGKSAVSAYFERKNKRLNKN